MGWVSVRSVINQLRWFVTVVLMTRLGAVYAAFYMGLNMQLLIAQGASLLVGQFFLPLLAARLWGGSFRAVALRLFHGYLQVGFGPAVLIFFFNVVRGRTALEDSIKNQLHDGTDSNLVVISLPAYCLFLLLTLCRPVAGMYDGALIAFGDDKFSGMAVLVAIVPYLVIALVGKKSFDAIYLAEVVFSITRAVLMHIRLVLLGWSPFHNFTDLVTFEADWQNMVASAKGHPSGLRRYFHLKLICIAYVTTCLKHTFPDPTFQKMLKVRTKLAQVWTTKPDP
jgi:hypothetical protein